MIKPKEKKCKGTSKAINFIGCNELAFKRTYGLCNKCLKKWYLETKEGKAQLNKITLKITKPRRSLEDAIKTDEQTKGIQAALQNTKVQVHKMISKRDKFKPCISCGCQWNENLEAGHYFAVNNYRSIRFNFSNINGQCYFCNNAKDGNFAAYTLRLPDRIGNESFNELTELALKDKQFNKHWTLDELKEIRKNAKIIIKELDIK